MIKNHFQIQRLKKILAKVKSFESEMAGLSDAELRKKTQEFKEKLAAGETLDGLLPEAYAVVREADLFITLCLTQVGLFFGCQISTTSP